MTTIKLLHVFAGFICGLALLAGCELHSAQPEEDYSIDQAQTQELVNEQELDHEQDEQQDDNLDQVQSPATEDQYDFDVDLLDQDLEPYVIPNTSEELVSFIQVGKSRYGCLQLQSIGDTKQMVESNRKVSSGDFKVMFDEKPGGSSEEIIRLDSIKLAEDVTPWQWQVITFDSFDLFILQADQSEYNKQFNPLRNIQLFAVIEDETAIPITFHLGSRGETYAGTELTIRSDQPIKNENEMLTLYSPLPKMQKLTFHIDVKNGTSELVAAKDVSDVFQAGQVLADEQARILERLLLGGVGENVYDLDEASRNELLKLVKPEAKESESYQYIEQHKATYPRSFYWGVSDVRFDKETGMLSFTFSMNVFYSIGQDLRLEVSMNKEGDTWMFQNFGALHIEYVEGGPQGASIEK